MPLKPQGVTIVFLTGGTQMQKWGQAYPGKARGAGKSLSSSASPKLRGPCCCLVTWCQVSWMPGELGTG